MEWFLLVRVRAISIELSPHQPLATKDRVLGAVHGESNQRVRELGVEQHEVSSSVSGRDHDGVE